MLHDAVFGASGSYEVVTNPKPINFSSKRGNLSENFEINFEELLWALELPAYYRLKNVSCRPNAFDVRYVVFHSHH